MAEAQWRKRCSAVEFLWLVVGFLFIEMVHLGLTAKFIERARIQIVRERIFSEIVRLPVLIEVGIENLSLSVACLKLSFFEPSDGGLVVIGEGLPSLMSELLTSLERSVIELIRSISFGLAELADAR